MIDVGVEVFWDMMGEHLPNHWPVDREVLLAHMVIGARPAPLLATPVLAPHKGTEPNCKPRRVVAALTKSA